jgi:hypothetical protein
MASSACPEGIATSDDGQSHLPGPRNHGRQPLARPFSPGKALAAAKKTARFHPRRWSRELGSFTPSSWRKCGSDDVFQRTPRLGGRPVDMVVDILVLAQLRSKS